MTIMDFREHVRRLMAVNSMEPLDRRDLDLAVKNVSTYRTIGQVDIDAITRLSEKYTPQPDENG